jgi:hypothetical protein
VPCTRHPARARGAAQFDEYLNDDDASVVGFFAEEGSALDDFKATAETMQVCACFATWVASCVRKPVSPGRA